MDMIEIRINNEEIKLTEFPAKIILNTIIGMLQSLRGVEKIESAEIRLKRDA